jgi:hypothetical protein
MPSPEGSDDALSWCWAMCQCPQLCLLFHLYSFINRQAVVVQAGSDLDLLDKYTEDHKPFSHSRGLKRVPDLSCHLQLEQG